MGLFGNKAPLETTVGKIMDKIPTGFFLVIDCENGVRKKFELGFGAMAEFDTLLVGDKVKFTHKAGGSVIKTIERA